MPFTFIAGQHGFALFAPYLAAFLAVAHLTRGWRRKAVAVTVDVPVTAIPAMSS
jgi:hypothetical protein